MTQKTKTRTRKRADGHRVDVEKYRAVLLDLRQQLTNQVRALSSVSLKASKQAGEELADVGSDDFVRETELVLMGEEGRRLALVDAALKRLDGGGYGVCKDCGQNISPGRLDAKPYAFFCIDCKTTREANGDVGFEQ